MSVDERLRAYLEGLSRLLVAQPEGLSVKTVDGKRATRFEIHLPAEERGQLIGREGATIRALRSVAGIVAEKHRRRFEVEIPG